MTLETQIPYRRLKVRRNNSCHIHKNMIFLFLSHDFCIHTAQCSLCKSFTGCGKKKLLYQQCDNVKQNVYRLRGGFILIGLLCKCVRLCTKNLKCLHQKVNTDIFSFRLKKNNIITPKTHVFHLFFISLILRKVSSSSVKYTEFFRKNKNIICNIFV